ncbi:MAG: hypothetical protein LBK66_07705, partial [Spirochaetaceae bacterium]|nr:hypothetical protein [Spirochaetaceae bacterium]
LLLFHNFRALNALFAILLFFKNSSFLLNEGWRIFADFQHIKFRCFVVLCQFSLCGGDAIDKLIGESVQIFDTLVPVNDNNFAVTNVDKKKSGLVT